jgi:hypothetical protein
MSTARLECVRARALLETYLDGDLADTDPQLALDMRGHLAGCADCRRQHEHAVSLPFRLKALTLTSPPPPDSLAREVIRVVAPVRSGDRKAWSLLAPEAALVSFILWYLSGLDGLGTIASGILGDLQGLAGWGSGDGPIPVVPPVDVVLLLALIALTAIAAYHLTILIRLAPQGLATHHRT